MIRGRGPAFARVAARRVHRADPARRGRRGERAVVRPRAGRAARRPAAAAARRQAVLLLRRRVLLRAHSALALAQLDARHARAGRQHARPLHPLELARAGRRRVRLRRAHQPAPQPARGAAAGPRAGLRLHHPARSGDPQRVAQRRLPGLAADAAGVRACRCTTCSKGAIPPPPRCRTRTPTTRPRSGCATRPTCATPPAGCTARWTRCGRSPTACWRCSSTTTRPRTPTTRPIPRRTCKRISAGSTRGCARWSARSPRPSSTPTRCACRPRRRSGRWATGTRATPTASASTTAASSTSRPCCWAPTRAGRWR